MTPAICIQSRPVPDEIAGQGQAAASRKGMQAANGLIIFTATLPLQWQVLAQTPVGVLRWFHIGAVFMVLLARPNLSTLREVRQSVSPVPVAVVLLTLATIITALGNSASLSGSIQQLFYAIVGLYAAACLVLALRSDCGRQRIAWIAPICLAVFLTFFLRALRTSGVSFETAISAIMSGDTSALLFGVFRTGFSSAGVDVSSNARHEVFAALLVAACISACIRRRGIVGVLSTASIVLIVVLVILSLSRAVTLVLVLSTLLVVFRSLVRMRAGVSAVLGGFVALAVSPVVVPPMYKLLRARYTDTQSLQERFASVSQLQGDSLIARLLTGGPDLSVSTHNLVLDSALRGTWLAGFAAAVLTMALFWMAGKLAVQYLDGGAREALAGYTAATLAIVRAFSAGGGYVPQPEWLGLALTGAVIVVTQAHMRAASESRVPTNYTDARKTTSAQVVRPATQYG